VEFHSANEWGVLSEVKTSSESSISVKCTDVESSNRQSRRDKDLKRCPFVVFVQQESIK